MTKRSRVQLFVIFAFVLFSILALVLHPGAESKFRKLFSETSIGIPGRQELLSFDQPADAVKGDYFTTTFTQSEDQFQQLTNRLRISGKQLLAVSGTVISMQSRINPGYPWLLTITAELTNTPGKLYLIKIEGRQAYNRPR